MWQDYVFTTGGLFFVWSQTMMLRNPRTSVPRASSVPTASVLWAFAATHASLGFYWAAVSTCVGAALWTCTAVFRPAR